MVLVIFGVFTFCWNRGFLTQRAVDWFAGDWLFCCMASMSTGTICNHVHAFLLDTGLRIVVGTICVSLDQVL